VADDPGSRCSSGRAGVANALPVTVGRHWSLTFRSGRALPRTSPRFALSNHHFRMRSGGASFV
jgi:hypothetical protein